MTEADDSWLDDDGRDGTESEATPLASLAWVLAAAGIMLLLPRQWVSAVMAFVLAGVVALIDRQRRKAQAPAPPAKAAEDDQGSQSTPP